MQTKRLSPCSQLPLLAGLLVAVATLLSGCGKGSNQVSIEGAVSVNGQSIENGAITFTPIAPTKGHTAGAKIVGGRYKIDGDKGPAAGKFCVAIIATRKTGKQVPDVIQKDRMIDAVEQFIPDKYNTKSQLEVELREGANKDVNFDLKM